MTYIPKHAKPKVFKFEIDVMESERGWGQSWWTEQFDTSKEAEARIVEINSHNKPGPAPDYYIQAMNEIRRVEVDNPPQT